MQGVSHLYFHGLKVVASPALTPPAKFSFSAQCGASEEVIRRMNEWLLSVFGNAREDAIVLKEEGIIVVSPDALAKLKAVAARWSYARY